ncbi:plasmid pRiA4b ORF-3 family protein [Enterovibrio sp. Hal110]
MDDTFLPPGFDQFIDLLESGRTFNELDRAQIAFLSTPLALFVALPYGFVILDESDDEVCERFMQMFDFIVNELRISVRNQADNNPYEKALETTLLDVVNVTPMNAMIGLEMVKVLNRHHFTPPAALLSHIAEQMSAHSPAGASSNTLITLLDQQGFTDGIEFALFFSAELSLLPPEGIHHILSLQTSKPWVVDALLLLSLDSSPIIAHAAADVLDTIAEKKWKQLTHRKLLVLAQQFADESVKPYLSRWNKCAAKYAKSRENDNVVELHASFADGCHSVLFYGLIRGRNKSSTMFGGAYRLGYGLVDATYLPGVAHEQYQNIIDNLTQELCALKCDPQLLHYLLPDALYHQRSCPEPLGLEALMLLAILPNAWTEPQPFDLERVAKLCHFNSEDPAKIDRGRLNSTLLLRTPMIDSWFIDDIDDKYTKRNQVRDHYYLKQPEKYVRSLAHSAVLAHFSADGDKLFWSAMPNLFLATAYYLGQCGEGQLGRKKFPLFDQLAERSLERKKQSTAMEKAAQLANQSPKAMQLIVELIDSKPRVWRRFKVSSHLDLESLHHLLQDIMGWEYAHMYMFQTHLGVVTQEQEGALEAEDLPIFAVLTEEGESIEYMYDFGDSWQHKITLEKVLARDIHCPLVTAGRGACPPENCGGVWGYENLLAISKQKNQAMRTWNALNGQVWMTVGTHRPLINKR